MMNPVSLCYDFGLCALACPQCGERNLHQDLVSVFARKEDAGDTYVTMVDNYEATVSARIWPSVATNNPSTRRQGAAIRFTCEHCPDDRFELTIAQHKGATYLEWRKA